MMNCVREKWQLDVRRTIYVKYFSVRKDQDTVNARDAQCTRKGNVRYECGPEGRAVNLKSATRRVNHAGVACM